MRKKFIGTLLSLMMLLGGVTIIYADEIVTNTPDICEHFISTEETLGYTELSPMLAQGCEGHTHNYSKECAVVALICGREGCPNYIYEYYGQCSCGEVARTHISHVCKPKT